MKKICKLILIIMLLTTNIIFLKETIKASAEWKLSSIETIDLGYGVTLDKVKGTSKSSYNSTTTIDGRTQSIYTASISASSPARIVQWSKFSGVENSWGSFTLEVIAADYEAKHPNEKVLVATNNWLASTNSSNRGELDCVQISNGLNYRLSDKQGESSSPVFAHDYIERTNFLGFDSTGKVAYYTNDWNNGNNYTSYLTLSYYTESSLDRTMLNIDVLKINEEPDEGEVAIYFSNYEGESTVSNATIYKMKGTRLMHDIAYNTTFVERDAFACGTYEGISDSLDFNVSTAGAYVYYFVSKNAEFDAFEKENKTIVCQYELLGDYQNVVGGTGYYFQIVRDGVTYPSDFGAWNEINCEVHPRTAFIIKEDGSFALSVIDGRQTGATGMDYEDMANFYKTQYNAYNVFNYDGGGSSCMVIDDGVGGFKIVNSPSDGSERRVANATLIVVTKEPYTVEQVNYMPNEVNINVNNISSSVTHIYATLNDITKEVIDGSVTFTNLTKGMSYQVSFKYVEEGEEQIGSTLNATTCMDFATLYSMDISFENQSTAIFNIVIDDSDSTFYQGYILYDDKKYYFLTKEAEVKISGLHSSTTYQAKLYIESLNGTSNMHKDEYILSSFTTPEAKYPDDFTVDLKKYVLTIGEKTSTIITSTPDNVYTTYTYSSSDETIVTVNSDGRVTAVGEGICTIYVTSKQGITRSIDIEVEAISTSEQTEKTKKCGKKSFGELIALTTTLSMLIYILRKKN